MQLTHKLLSAQDDWDHVSKKSFEMNYSNNSNNLSKMPELVLTQQAPKKQVATLNSSSYNKAKQK